MVKSKKDQVRVTAGTGQRSERRAESQRVARAAVLLANILTARERHEGLPHESGNRHHKRG
jgi:hypothetical protein